MIQLTDQEIYDYCWEAFHDVSDEAVIIMGAICLAESGGKVDAVGDNYASGHQSEFSAYRWDRGLAQINSVHNFFDARLLVTDPQYNLEAARMIYDWQGFYAWSTFKGGQFRAFVPRMEACVTTYAPEPTVPLSPPFAKADLAPIYFLVYNLTSKASIEPQPMENGNRVYKVVIRD